MGLPDIVMRAPPDERASEGERRATVARAWKRKGRAEECTTPSLLTCRWGPSRAPPPQYNLMYDPKALGNTLRS